MNFFNFNFEKNGFFQNKRENHIENSSEKKENLEKIYDRLLRHSLYIDKGKNGIITKVNFNKTPFIDLELLFNFDEKKIKNNNNSGQIALKLLKIYESGKGVHEFNLQNKAYNILKEYPQAAQTPRALAFKEIEIKSLSLKNKLKYWGVKLPQIKLPKDLVEKYLLDKNEYDQVEFSHLPSNVQRKLYTEANIEFPLTKIEILVMDYISGKDLATILFREVLVRHKDCALTLSEIEDMHFEELNAKVSELLNLDSINPDLYYTSSLFKKMQLKRDFRKNNINKMILFLKETGYRFPKIWLDKIRHALYQLHEKGIYHRDLHERNIIINEEGDPFIIDFGSAKQIKSAYKFRSKNQIYNEKKIYISDEEIVEHYKKLI